MQILTLLRLWMWVLIVGRTNRLRWWWKRTIQPWRDACSRRREDAFFRRLGRAPLHELVGIIDPFGMTGHAGDATVPGGLGLRLDVWRLDAGPVRKSRFVVRRRIHGTEELAFYEDRLLPQSIVRLRVRCPNLAGKDEAPVALLEEFVRIEADDAEMNAVFAELTRVTTWEDDRLGTLTYDRGFRWYVGRVRWHGQGVELKVEAADRSDPHAALNVAHRLWEDEATWDRRIRDFAVDRLLPVKNWNWREDGEDEVSPAEFESRMVLRTVAVRADGGFDFWYEDGDLFLGHAIEVRGNLTDGPVEVGLAG